MSSLNIAYYATPHGLGHATRALEIIRSLMSRGHAVVLSSGPAVGLFFQSQLQNEEKIMFTFRTAVFDSGALQPHAFTVDMAASLREYYQRADGDHRQARIQVRSLCT
jgi:L-arabinokinase